MSNETVPSSRETESDEVELDTFRVEANAMIRKAPVNDEREIDKVVVENQLGDHTISA